MNTKYKTLYVEVEESITYLVKIEIPVDTEDVNYFVDSYLAESPWRSAAKDKIVGQEYNIVGWDYAKD